MSLLARSSRRYLTGHPWQSGLAVLGITLAVAVVVGIDLANSSAERAFELSVEGVAGRATHEVRGGAGGLAEEVYTDLRKRGFRDLAPVVEDWVALPEGGSRVLRLFGIDPFAEASLRDFTGALARGGGDIVTFLTQPGAAALTPELAEELSISPGQSFDVLYGGRTHTLEVVALLHPTDELARRSARDLIVVDLATAQEVLARQGFLDHIDALPAAEGLHTAEALAASLPEAAILETKASRSDALGQMTRAFRLNLEALSLLALLVGSFLIYNTMTFSVVQRRPLIGRLRTLGVTRREIFRRVLGEAALLATIGSVLGGALGLLLARGLLQLVTRTINDLYFVLQVEGVSPSPESLAKGLGLGLLGTLLAAVPPALEATRAAPGVVLQRSSIEGRTRRALPRFLLAGLVLGLLSAALLALPTQALPPSFAAIFCFTLACACLVPPATFAAARILARPLGALGGLLGRMAARGVAANLSRTGVAVAALVIAVSMSIGVGVMVNSFRGTLEDWLATTLQADVYATPADIDRRGPTKPLDPALVERLLQTPGVAHGTTFRRLELDTQYGPSTLVVVGPGREGFASTQFKEGKAETAWPSFREGAVIVSEPYAHHHGVAVGDTVELLTDQGPHPFPVAGIYYDYATDRGVVTLHRETWRRHWRDDSVNSLGLYAEPGEEVDALVERLRQQAGDGQALAFAPNRELRRGALEIFDRTFLITSVLRLLALGVAFIGILSALMALQLERTRELAVLRTNGLTPRQVWGLTLGQTGLMGLIAGLLSVPLGLALAYFLIEVINRRAFGWTLLFDPSPPVLFQAVVLSTLAALAAGLYPARRMATANPARALREE